MDMNAVIEQIRNLMAEESVLSWLVLAGAAVIVASVMKLCLRVIAGRLRRFAERTSSTWDDAGVDLLDGVKGWVLFVWAFYLLTRPMNAHDSIHRGLLTAVVTVTAYQAGLWGLGLIKNWRQSVLDRRIQEDPSSAAALGLFYTLVRMVFIVVIVLIGLSNLGVNISALLAGLGVGGIAVALAAQNVLGDLLASLSIVLDKPFVVGDFIASGSEKGTVEHIGIKTTRVRSVSGEELILSNKNLLESRIQNYKRMWERRIVHKFGVVYTVPPEVLEKIPLWVKDFVLQHEKLRFDRCHFCGYGASSLDFELVFFVKDPDYIVYMDIQQKLLLDILKKFAEEKIEFAYPTQSLLIEKLPEVAMREQGPRALLG